MNRIVTARPTQRGKVLVQENRPALDGDRRRAPREGVLDGDEVYTLIERITARRSARDEGEDPGGSPSGRSEAPRDRPPRRRPTATGRALRPRAGPGPKPALAHPSRTPSARSGPGAGRSVSRAGWKRAGAPPPRAGTVRTTRRHPLFGEVPIVPGPGAAGGPGRLWSYDPDYRPDLPCRRGPRRPPQAALLLRRPALLLRRPRPDLPRLRRAVRLLGARAEALVRDARLPPRRQCRPVPPLPSRLPPRQGNRAGALRRLARPRRGATPPPAVLAYARAAVADAERFGHAPLDARSPPSGRLGRDAPRRRDALPRRALRRGRRRPGRAAACYERFLATAAPRGNAASPETPAPGSRGSPAAPDGGGLARLRLDGGPPR